MKFDLTEFAKRLAEQHHPDMDVVARTFTFSVSEDKKISKWLGEHQAGNDCPLKQNRCPLTNEPFYMGAIGGGLTYSFTPTGLGQVIKVTCACGAEKDVTDYECW